MDVKDELSSSGKRKKIDEHPSVTLFREYLRIRTVQPSPDYDGAVEFLKRLAQEIGLEFHCLEVVAKKPIVVLTWRGENESLSSILLNSHIDVVPVSEEHWTHPPFEAFKNKNGDIFARGTQDMKCVGIQYIEAVRQLKSEGKRFQRTIHLSFVPDEEIGGRDGMKQFVTTPDFKKMNIGFALDEGLASPTDIIPVFYGERSVLWIKFHVNGNTGHGSRFVENTSAEKVLRLMNQIWNFRESQKKRLEENKDLKDGDVTTVNITLLEGGQQLNVIPAEFTIGADFRIEPSQDLQEFEELIKSWVKKAGEDITYALVQRCDSTSTTSISPENIWWCAFRDTCLSLNLKISPEVFPAGTDCRFLREVGIPALGFSPMPNTPVLLHCHNEFLNENIFLEGIPIYYKLISSLASVKEF